eukprot:g5990.t1
MKWGSLQISESKWNFDDADYFVQFCLKNGIKVKGHALVWHNQTPPFISKVSNGEMLLYYMEAHVRKSVSHFKGKVRSWDVLNEIISDDGKSLRNCIFTKYLGWDFISKIFHWAHEEDPNCLLFYNDYDIGHVNSKSNFAYKMIKDLLEQDVPIHGVGFQGHIHANHYNINSIDENIRRFIDLGIYVNFSEIDVRVRGVSDDADARLDKQKHVYREIAKCAFKYEKFESITMWGFTDLHSWVHGFFGPDEPLLWNKKYEKKPAYYGFLEGVAGDVNSERGAISNNSPSGSIRILLNNRTIHASSNCMVSDAVYYVKKGGLVLFKMDSSYFSFYRGKFINRINLTVSTKLTNKTIELFGYTNRDDDCNQLELLCRMQLKTTNSYDNYQVQSFKPEKKFRITSNAKDGKGYCIFSLIFRDNNVGNFQAIEFLGEKE